MSQDPERLLHEGLVLRQVHEADLDAVAAIYNETIDAGTASMDTVHKTGEEMKHMVQGFHARELMLVLCRDRVILGYGLIKRYSERRGYRTTCETAVYLTTAEQRKGYGSLIKRELIDQCRTLGYHHVVAKVLASNTASLIYNQRLGYQVVGVQKEVGMIQGRWCDVVIMQLLL